MNDVMIRNCDSGRYLGQINIGSRAVRDPLLFVFSPCHGALVFENEKEAQATIDFISAVVDWETAECLEIVIVP